MACYRIAIGNAVIDYDQRWHHLAIEPEVVFLDACPWSPDARANWIDYGGYGLFAEFCERNDLTNLMFGTGWQVPGCRYGPCLPGFHRDEPLRNGPAVLCPDDLRVIRAARQSRERTNGGRKGYLWFMDSPEFPIVEEDRDEDLGYLQWIEWWMEWALTNCERPIITIA